MSTDDVFKQKRLIAQLDARLQQWEVQADFVGLAFNLLWKQSTEFRSALIEALECNLCTRTRATRFGVWPVAHWTEC